MIFPLGLGSCRIAILSEAEEGKLPADPIISLYVPCLGAGFLITNAALRRLTANVFSPFSPPYAITIGSGIRRFLSGPKKKATVSGNFLCNGVREKERRSDQKMYLQWVQQS